MTRNYGTSGFSGDGSFFLWGAFGELNAWDVAHSAGGSDADAPDHHATTGATQSFYEAVAVSPDGSLLATAAAGTVHVASATTDASTEPVLDELTGSSRVTTGSVAFVGSTRLVSATGTSIASWDLAAVGRTGVDVGVDLPFGCRACQPQLSPSPDGRLVAYVDGASSGQSLATVYRLEGQGDPQLLSDPSAPADGSFRLDAVVPVWSHDGRRLVLLGPGDDTALSFDAEDLRQPPVRWPPAYSSADPLVARLSADGGRLLVVYADGTVVVRDVHDGTAVETIPGGAELDRLSWPPPPTAAAVSPDLTTVALVEQDDVHLLDIRTGERRPLPGGPADGVLFTGNQLLVLRPDRTVDVWDPHGRSVLRTTAGGDYALPLAAPHDSHVLARLRSDDSVVLTLTGSGTTLGELPLPPTQGSATNLAFTEDGRYLVVGTTGGRLTRWDMTEAAWLHHACQTAGRDLTTGEWRRFVGTDPPADLRCDRAL